MTTTTTSVVPQFLAQYGKDAYVKGWADLWDRGGDYVDWDKGCPNPALEDTLLQQRSILGGPITLDEQGRWHRKKALVPGCGSGLDVLLLASFGYDAYGLEYSHSAVQTCKAQETRSRARGEYPVRDEEVGRGSVTFMQGDFFRDAWLEGIGLGRGDYDVIYDHSFFCALDPSLRPQWGQRKAQLLAPTGRLICLEFPRHQDPSEMGPPYTALSEDYIEHLSQPGLKRVAYWKPERTHANGFDAQGVIQDRVSIWCW
ncbi:hypothetical protein SI65_07452 [Aspergillus cristatus]|uniref:Thiol methyltransferase 2 n=1 Tax=Aspergillus cristatus TaxID=573508 RepID=A0A1E3B7V7_ASPCR|nr:hypothetical protein SI65_07452 [Aspergillus cristatus]